MAEGRRAACVARGALLRAIARHACRRVQVSFSASSAAPEATNSQASGFSTEAAERLGLVAGQRLQDSLPVGMQAAPTKPAVARWQQQPPGRDRRWLGEHRCRPGHIVALDVFFLELSDRLGQRPRDQQPAPRNPHQSKK
jgi:hypothetical protein